MNYFLFVMENCYGHCRKLIPLSSYQNLFSSSGFFTGKPAFILLPKDACPAAINCKQYFKKIKNCYL
jgi:hypothetical protein